MNFNILYTVLKYIPSPIRMESIIVGLAVHIPAKSFSHFYKIKNTRRVAAFDDEYNKDFFNMIMESLSYDLDYQENEHPEILFDNKKERFKDIEDADFLEERTAYLANDFQFSPIESLQTNDKDLKDDLEDLQKMYLYYDRPKPQRITKTEVKRLLKKQINSYHLSNLVMSPKVYDEFGGTNLFDYEINNEIYVKAISFDYKRLNQLSSELKSIIYDLNTIQVSKVILTRNENLELLPKEQLSAFKTFKNKLYELEKSKNLNIHLVPLSELEQTLNKI
ncbi:DUF3037 domain-containing protein [Limosilactobacillus fermentum]|uniref:DUF3037 domain-containing protein n=1 Tax=Limosilactobacillus fermentum TaxID=1613 RepID=UPI0030EE1961